MTLKERIRYWTVCYWRQHDLIRWTNENGKRLIRCRRCKKWYE